MTDQKTVFGAGGDAYDALILKTDVPIHIDQYLFNTLPGFTADPDGFYFEQPTGSGGVPLEYFNAAGVSQWTALPVDFGSGSWCGYMLDNTDQLVYLLFMNTTTNLFTLGTVDSAGTKITIDTFQPATDFAADPLLGQSNVLQRVADGSGNFFLRDGSSTGTNGVESIEFTAAGVLVGDLVVEVPPTGRNIGLAYKTANDIFLGNTQENQNAGSTKIGALYNLTTGANLSEITTDLFSRVTFPSSGVVWPLQWNGYIIMGTNNATAQVDSSNRYSETVDFETFITDVATYYGLLP